MTLKAAEPKNKKIAKHARKSVRAGLWTFDELLAEMGESNQPSELWDGELIMAPAPTFQHQQISQRIEAALDAWIVKHKNGVMAHAPIDVILAPRRVVQPDIIYVSDANREIIQDRVRGVPDLVIEIISPGSWRRDQIEKKALYEQFGISEYWIVDPEAEMIQVLFLDKGKYELVGRFGRNQKASSKLLSGFEVDVNKILP